MLASRQATPGGRIHPRISGRPRARHAGIRGHGVRERDDGDHSQDVARQFEARLMEIPEIISCHHVSGRYDFLLEVIAADLHAFGAFTREVLQALPGVKEIYRAFR